MGKPSAQQPQGTDAPWRPLHSVRWLSSLTCPSPRPVLTRKERGAWATSSRLCHQHPQNQALQHFPAPHLCPVGEVLPHPTQSFNKPQSPSAVPGPSQEELTALRDPSVGDPDGGAPGSHGVWGEGAPAHQSRQGLTTRSWLSQAQGPPGQTQPLSSCHDPELRTCGTGPSTQGHTTATRCQALRSP